MKIAVIADVHANLQALQTVVEDVHNWRPDQVIVLGDLVNRGPRPAECLALVQQHVARDGWLMVRGNHEDYVIQHAAPGAPRYGPAFNVHRASYWTYQQLGGNVTALEAMPDRCELSDPHGGELDFFHGSFLGTRNGIHPETRDEELDQKLGLHARLPGSLPPVLFCVGHTHRPLQRYWRGTLIVNAGSAGLPFDGDTRLAYARLSLQNGAWSANIVRLSYDLAAAERDFTTTGYLEGGGPLVSLVLRELRTATSQLYDWAIRYQDAATRGEISMEESVRLRLAAGAER